MSAPVGRSGRDAGAGAVEPSATSSATASSDPATSSAPVGEHVDLAAVGHELAGLVRVGEEGDRRPRVDEHEVAQPAELLQRHLAEVLQLLDGGDAGAALGAGDERLGDEPGAGRRGDAAGGVERWPAHRRTAEQQGDRLARTQQLGDELDGPAVDRRRAAEPRTGATGAAPSLHDTSAGRMRVATWPGGPMAAATASAVVRQRSAVRSGRRIQPDTLRAAVSMSEFSGASSPAWYVAWSPTMLTIGVDARRALCRLARPLPRPGPRCSSVAAGTPAMRA